MDWFKEHILRILRFSESKYTVGGSCELESVYVNMCLVFAMENGGFTGYWLLVYLSYLLKIGLLYRFYIFSLSLLASIFL